jgi:hypothetical protein
LIVYIKKYGIFVHSRYGQLWIAVARDIGGNLNVERETDRQRDRAVEGRERERKT